MATFCFLVGRGDEPFNSDVDLACLLQEGIWTNTFFSTLMER
jgi:hypothetical protein